MFSGYTGAAGANARQSFGWGRKPEGIIAVVLIIAMVALLGWALQTFCAFRASTESEDLVAHTHQVRDALHAVASALDDAQGAERGLILTGDENYQKRYGDARSAVHHALNAVGSLTLDNASHQKALLGLRSAVDAKLAELQDTIALYRRSGQSAALPAISSDHGEALMNDAQRRVTNMLQEEERLLETRRVLVEQAVQRTQHVILFGSMGLLALLAALAAAVYRLLLPPSRPVIEDLEPEPAQRAWIGYIVAVLGVALAAWVRWQLGLSLGREMPPYITFYPVIIFAALLGGTGAGLLATLLAAVLVCFIFLPPVGTFVVGRPVDIASLTLFVAINLVMSVVGGALRLSRNRSHQQSRVLARTVDMLDLTTVMVLDPEYRIIRWNSGCRRLYGYTSEQALGKVAHVLLQTRFPVPLEEIRGELARTGRWQGELRQVASDGREIIVAGEWQARGAAAGQPSAIIETNTDITDRKRAEEKLQQSEEYLRLAAIAARMGVWSWKPGTSEVVVSESWRTLFGLPPGTPTTFETWRNMVHPDDRDGVVAKLEEAWHQGHEFNAEYRIVCPDGSVRWLVDRGRGWYNPAGEATSIAGINVDITERKQAEQVLARSAADLERLVRERTAKLHEMVAELEHFSYTITHDMRAPLRAMRGLAELLVEECGASLTGERGAYLRQIASSAERMDALITDALQYSLIVRGKFELEPVDADALLRGILESYPQFHPPNAQVRVANRLPVVLANKAGLTQCFSNLLGNAVKFVRPGQVPEVVVRAEPGGNGAARVQPPAPEHAASSPLSAWHLPPGEAPAPAPTVRICIEDKGIGIEREYQDKIWLMFQRLDKSYAGTGIGLALVRKAVERMGGRVGVESERGHGSRFWVELQQANGQER